MIIFWFLQKQNWLPYYLGYKAMALYPIQGHLAFWKIELSAIYKAMALYPL